MAGEPSTVEKKENSVAKFKLACTGVHLAQRFRPLNPSGVVSSKNGSLSTKPITRRRLSLFLFGFCFLFWNLLAKKTPNLKDFFTCERGQTSLQMLYASHGWGSCVAPGVVLRVRLRRREYFQYMLYITWAYVPAMCFHLYLLLPPPVICKLFINNTKSGSKCRNFILFHQKTFCWSGDFFFLLMVFRYLERLVVSSHKCLNVEKKNHPRTLLDCGLENVIR